MSGADKPEGRIGVIVPNIEESTIAQLQGLMTPLTFANVVMRCGFNSQLIRGLDLTLVLFAWLVLFGITYGFTVVSHLGVDATTGRWFPTEFANSRDPGWFETEQLPVPFAQT